MHFIAHVLQTEKKNEKLLTRCRYHHKNIFIMIQSPFDQIENVRQQFYLFFFIFMIILVSWVGACDLWKLISIELLFLIQFSISYQFAVSHLFHVKWKHCNAIWWNFVILKNKKISRKWKKCTQRIRKSIPTNLISSLNFVLRHNRVQKENHTCKYFEIEVFILF